MLYQTHDCPQEDLLVDDPLDVTALGDGWGPENNQCWDWPEITEPASA